MSISMQTLQDALVALVTTVGVGVALALAFLAAGALFERDQKRRIEARRPGAVSAQHPTQTDSPRDLVSR